MKIKLGLVLAVLLIGAWAMPAGATQVLAPVIGSAISNASFYGTGNTGAWVEINFGANGAISTHFISGVSTYDAPVGPGDDVMVNVFNNSGSTLPSLHLTGSPRPILTAVFLVSTETVWLLMVMTFTMERARWTLVMKAP